MEITTREFWTLVHGMGFGAIFLLAFAGGLAGLYSLRPEWVTATGMQERMMRLNIGLWGMAIVVWLTVIVGTWVVYPWYRATPPAGVDLKNAAALVDYPRYFLLAQETTAEWHKFGMEWKEHVAWLAPIAATMVAALVSYYGARLAKDTLMKRAVAVLFVVAFVASASAGVFGALITKAAPLH
jgi:phosphoglycerol transferase MdoB-like AlkP superfamily enzyme